MLFLFLGCFQITDSFHSIEEGTGGHSAAENSFYLKLEPDAELHFKDRDDQSWVEELTSSQGNWAVSMGLPEGLPSAAQAGFDALALLQTDQFALAIDLQRCKVYYVNFEGNVIPLDLNACSESDIYSSTLVGGRLSLLMKPDGSSMEIEVFENTSSRGLISFALTELSDPGSIVLGGSMDPHNYPVLSPGLAIDQLVFLSPESVGSLTTLQQNHPYADNQLLWEQLAVGSYLFPIGEADTPSIVGDITQNYFGDISFLPEDQDSSYLAIP